MRMQLVGVVILGGALAACGGKAKPAAAPNEDFSKMTTLDYTEDTMGPTAAPTDPSPPTSNKTAIRATIREGAAKFVACADKEAAAVTLTLTFAITASGNVGSAKATGGADATNTCAADVVASLNFGAQNNLTNVVYPIKITK